MSSEWLYLSMRVKPEDVEALAGIDGMELARAIAPVLKQTVYITDVYLGIEDPSLSTRVHPEHMTQAKIDPDGTAVRVAAK